MLSFVEAILCYFHRFCRLLIELLMVLSAILDSTFDLFAKSIPHVYQHNEILAHIELSIIAATFIGLCKK